MSIVTQEYFAARRAQAEKVRTRLQEQAPAAKPKSRYQVRKERKIKRVQNLLKNITF